MKSDSDIPLELRDFWEIQEWKFCSRRHPKSNRITSFAASVSSVTSLWSSNRPHQDLYESPIVLKTTGHPLSSRTHTVEFFCKETTDQNQNRCFNLFARLVRDGRFVSPNRFLLERFSTSGWEGNSISLAHQLSLVTPLPISGRERNSIRIASLLSLVKLLPVISRSLWSYNQAYLDTQTWDFCLILEYVSSKEREFRTSTRSGKGTVR